MTKTTKTTTTDAQLIAEIASDLRCEFSDPDMDWGGVPTIANIPTDRLRAEIADAQRTNARSVTVKIPSYCEFSMSLQHAQALLRSRR